MTHPSNGSQGHAGGLLYEVSAGMIRCRGSGRAESPYPPHRIHFHAPGPETFAFRRIALARINAGGERRADRLLPAAVEPGVLDENVGADGVHRGACGAAFQQASACPATFKGRTTHSEETRQFQARRFRPRQSATDGVCDDQTGC